MMSLVHANNPNCWARRKVPLSVFEVRKHWDRNEFNVVVQWSGKYSVNHQMQISVNVSTRKITHTHTPSVCVCYIRPLVLLILGDFQLTNYFQTVSEWVKSFYRQRSSLSSRCDSWILQDLDSFDEDLESLRGFLFRLFRCMFHNRGEERKMDDKRWNEDGKTGRKTLIPVNHIYEIESFELLQF